MSPEASYIDFWCKSMTRFYMHCDAGVKWLNVYQTTLSVEIRCFECLRTWVFEGKTGDKTLYSRINLETNFWKFLRIFRSSGTVVFRKKGILKNFTKLTVKRSLFFKKVPGWGLQPLYGKCRNTEFFMARIFTYSDRIWENTDQKKFHILTLFKRWTL